MREVCYLNTRTDKQEVEFMGIFQESNVIGESPLVGGHRGGTVSRPIAVIKVWEDGVGTLKEVHLSHLTFEKVDILEKNFVDNRTSDSSLVIVEDDGTFHSGEKVIIVKEVAEKIGIAQRVDVIAGINFRIGRPNTYRLTTNNNRLFTASELERVIEGVGLR